MLSSLAKIPPEAVALVLVLWILREVFGFATKVLKQRNGERSYNTVDALERVSDHIEAQTDLVKDMTRELTSVREAVVDLKDEIRLRH